MLKHRLTRVATIAALAAFAAACDSSTGPDIEKTFDTDAALADYEAMDAAFASPELAGFRALGARTPFGSTPAAIDVVAGLSAMGAPSAADGGRAFALNLVRRIQAAGATRGPARAPIISDVHRGSTFVYDPETDRYAVDPERAGAPGTGVRFITYEVDPGGTPVVDEETGYADLVDHGDASAEDVVLSLTVVQHEATVLEYRTTVDETADGGAFTVAGFLQGDDGRLDFDIGAVGTETERRTTLEVAFELRVDARDFSVTGTVAGVEEGDEGEGDVDLMVRHGSSSIAVDLTGSDGILDGTFHLNGELFATVSGPEDDPVFLGPEGRELTFGERLVLHRIVDSVEDVFDFLEDLVDPIDELVILAIVL